MVIEPSRKWVGRVAAEFVVIVLGVLVALAVDRYVGVRAESERATDALRALQEDLVASAEALRAANEGYERQSRTLMWLVNFPSDGSVQFPADSIFRVRLAAYQTSSYWPILRTHEALVSTGSLSLLGSEIQFGLADVNRSSANYLNFRAQTTETWMFTLMPEIGRAHV